MSSWDPGSAAGEIGFHKGVVKTWDSVTLRNTVEVNGGLLPDLPLLGLADAELIIPGSTVGIVTVGSSWAILGRFVIPNTPEAADATALLSKRTAAGVVLTQEQTSLATYTNLTTFGPSVTVTVRSTGRLLVMMGCWMQWAAANTIGGDMALNMSGANSLTPTPGDDSVRSWTSLGGGITHTQQQSPFGARVYTGLNVGETTLWATYKSVSGNAVDFSRRVLVVQVL